MTDRELNIAKVEALLDDLIASDPDIAERFIESRLAQLALKKRASERAKQASYSVAGGNLNAAPPAVQQQAEPDGYIDRYGVHYPQKVPGLELKPFWYAPPAVQQAEPVAWAVYWKDGQGLVSNGLSYVTHQDPITLHMDQVKVPLYAAPPADDEAVRLLREAQQYCPKHCETWDAIDAYLAKLGK